MAFLTSMLGVAFCAGLSQSQLPTPCPEYDQGIDRQRLLLVSRGGALCDTQWFTLPTSPFAPFVFPPFWNGVGTPPGNSPYTTPAGGGSTVAGNNPPPPSNSIATHSNVTRYWNTNPQVVIAIPRTVPALASGQPNLSTTVASTFPGLVPAASTYTWQNWVTDVQLTFAKFIGSTSANAPVPSITVAYSSVNYTTNGTLSGYPAQTFPFSALAAGQFVWGFPWLGGIGGVQGPTGNGRNEIILTDQASLAGRNGLTSMLVNPSTGVISESDVLIYAPGLIVASPAGGFTTPSEWTALTHEIGHFFGLDHTNLHAGVGGSIGTPAAPTSYTPVLAALTAAVYPTGLNIAALGAAPIPGMSGIISHIETGFNYSAQPLHPDDATSLAKVYPVAQPLAGSQKLPLINTTARIEGRLRSLGGPTNTNFGRNTWVVQEFTTGQANTFPLVGAVTGAARLDRSDAALFNSATTPYVFPGTTTPMFTGASVVGLQGCTGDFSIDGVIPGTIAAPLNYDIIFEDGAPLGLTSGNLAEWYQEGGFYTGNAMSSTPAYAPTVFRSQLAILFGAAFSSMRTVPGTVIVLDPSEHSEVALGAAGGGPIGELKTRPLVSASPRKGRFASPNLVISAVPTLGLGLNFSSPQLWVNGTNQSVLLASFPPSVAPNGVATWTIPMVTITGLFGGIPATTPIQVSFLIQDNLPAGSAPFQPAWGRNDVVL